MSSLVPGQVIMERQVQPREVDLFMFSAVSWLTARIHFDRAYALSEGYPDVVVHGPLQGAHLSQVLSDTASSLGAELVSLDYRHHQPAYCGDALTISGQYVRLAEADGSTTLELEVRVTNSADVVVTSGTAALKFAGQTADAVRSRLSG
jgi:hydroxyacyl-ACP dehydratase HTD2-like protein with hotdog domain